MLQGGLAPGSSSPASFDTELMQPESDMAGGGPGNMEGPELRAQAGAWVLGRR